MSAARSSARFRKRCPSFASASLSQASFSLTMHPMLHDPSAFSSRIRAILTRGVGRRERWNGFRGGPVLPIRGKKKCNSDPYFRPAEVARAELVNKRLDPISMTMKEILPAPALTCFPDLVV